MSTTPWDRFEMAAMIAKNAWNTQQNRNLGSAYERAERTYLATLKKQEEADKAAAERKAQLIMLALSLAGGSALSVLFSKTAAKEVVADLVQDATLKVVVEKGWERAFTVLAWTDKNATAKFVLGKLWDEAGSKLSSKVSDNFKQLGQGAKTVAPGVKAMQNPGPLEFQNGLMNFTDRLHSSILLTGQWLYDEMGGEKALERFMKASPFFKTPPQQMDVGKTAINIELIFWMKYMLSLDYMAGLKWHSSGLVSMSSRVVSKTSVDVSPWSTQYPKASRRHHFDMPDTELRYQQAGSIIRKRINELYSNVIGGQLFRKESGGAYNRVSLETLRLADNTLNKMSIRNAQLLKAMRA